MTERDEALQLLREAYQLIERKKQGYADKGEQQAWGTHAIKWLGRCAKLLGGVP